MKLIVTEKAIAGRRIASILVGKSVAAEKIGAAQLFSFKKDGQDYLIVPLRGHIMDVDFPQQYSYWIGTDLKTLVKAPIEYKETEKGIVSLLKKKAKEAEEVIIATDADREGEAIGVEALRFIQAVNPKIKVSRAYFSAVTPKDIKTAFSQLAQVDFNFADSADARREIDLIWGAVLTRFISIVSGRLGKEFLSAGRVQTPSVDYSEDVFVQNSEGKTFLAKIGELVESLKAGEPYRIGSCEVFDVKDKNFKALSFNKSSLKAEYKPITKVVRHRHAGSLIELTTETGRKVRVTGSHSVFCLKDGKISIMLTDELKKGDMVLSFKNMPSGNEITQIDLLNECLRLSDDLKERLFLYNAIEKKWLCVNERGREFLKQTRIQKKLIISKTRLAPSTISQIESGRTKRVSYNILSDYLQALGYDVDWFIANGFASFYEPVRKAIKLSEINSLAGIKLLKNPVIGSFDLKWAMPIKLKITPELMRLIGYYLAEGFISEKFVHLCFGRHELDLVKDAAHCISQVFGHKPKIHAKKSSQNIDFGGAFGKILFYNVLELGESAHTKKLPALAFNVSQALKLELLSGYFEGDGNYSTSGQLMSATVSRKLASDLAYLLLQLGVISSLSRQLNKSALPGESKSKPRFCYRVKISGKKNLSFLFSAIPRRHKNRAKSYLKNTITRCGYEGIPVKETNLSSIWKDLPRHYAQRISAAKLSRLVQNTNKKLTTFTLTKLKTLAATDISFLRITNTSKVKPTTDYVYDLSVEENENFVGGFGGIILHNTLALIVDREKERLAFKKEKFWVVSALFEKKGKEFLAEHRKGRFWEKEEAEKVMQKKAKQGKVIKVSTAVKEIKRPVPFNTTGFLRAASSIGVSAGEAMNNAETLYMQGLISYPRTDNSVYPATLNLKEILNNLVAVPEFSPAVEKILALGKLAPSRGKETKDHPPIHPVTAASKDKLPPRQWKIYELIARHFLATLGENAQIKTLTAEINLNKEPFVARGQVVLKPGWKEFYPYSVTKEVVLPELKEGDLVDLKELNLEEKETQPPNRYSQGTLIKQMEALSLGTKSTRHTIIQKLYSRQYLSGLKAIEPNKIGFAVIDSFEKHQARVEKPEMTAELEKEMDAVAAGKKSKKEIVDESKEMLSSVLETLIKAKQEIGSELRQALKEDSLIMPCPACKEGNLRLIRSRAGKRFVGCTSYPQCRQTYPLPQAGRIMATEKICPLCSSPVIKVMGRRAYEMCLSPECESKKDWGKPKRKAKTKTESQA